jgi:hypothetical protein
MSSKRALPSAATRSLQGHLPFVLLFVVGAVLRTLVCVAYRPALMLQRDAYAYLELALNPTPSPGSFRPVVYPLLFLKPLLVFDELALVPIVQHALALALAAILYVALRRLGVGAVLAALGVAPLILDGYQMDVEHYILSETLFLGLILVALVLLVWPARPGHIGATAAGALVALASLTRFAGVAAIVPALIYVGVRRLGWRTAALLLVGFLLPLLGYSAWFRSSEGTFGVTNRNGFFVYGRVASFADCAEIRPPKRLRRFCLEEPASDRGPNRGIWTLVRVGRLAREPGVNGLLLEFSKRAIVAQPIDYITVVGDDFARFLEPTPPPSQEPYVRRWRFPRTLSDARPHPLVRRYGGSAPPGTGLEEFRIVRAPADFLRAYQSFVYTPGPLIALLIAVGLIGVLLGKRIPRRRDVRPESILFTLAGVALLLLPVMTTVYHFRYVLPALPLLGAGAALGATAFRARGLARES